MLKPVFTCPESKRIGLAETTNFIYVDAMVFDKNSLTPASNWPGNALNTLANQVLDTTGATHGGQFATSDWNMNTLFLNPQLDTRVANAVLLEDKYNVITFHHHAGQIFQIDIETAEPVYQGRWDNSGYVYLGNKLYYDEVNNGVWSFFQYSYYGQAYVAFIQRTTSGWRYSKQWNLGNYCQTQVLYIEDGKFILVARTCGNSNFSIWYFDIPNLTGTNKLNFKNVTNNNGGRGSLTFLGEEGSKLYFYAVSPNEGRNAPAIKLVVFDKDTKGAATQDVQVVGDVPTTTGGQPNSGYSRTIAFISNGDNGKKYLHVAFANDEYANSNATSYGYIYTYEIGQNPTKLTFVGVTNTHQSFHGPIILDKDNWNTIILPSAYNEVKIAKFNGSEWELYNTGISKSRVTVLDNSGKLFIRTISDEVYVLVPTMPVRVDIHFEKQNYIYTGVPISTKVYVSAYNQFNERVSVQGTLKILTNNAKFEDGSQVKAVTTSATEDIAVPIKITGPGQVLVAFDYSYTGG